MSRRVLVCLLTVLPVMGCGDDAPPEGPDAAMSCASDGDCDDGAYCNGLERCGSSGSCESGDAPCSLGCDEATDRCATSCAVPDGDEDGAVAIDCGGTDCDDTDAERFPGNIEVCDAAGVDEDCNPDTYGDTDSDGDGYISAECCNGEACGDDCDDGAASVHPGLPEACDGVDNDCDGSVDEGALVTIYRDLDGDGFGRRDETMEACGLPPSGWAREPGDCDDEDAAVNPGAVESCDGVDNDCSGTVDDPVPPAADCPCSDGDTRTCGTSDTGSCRTVVQTCVSGAWPASCTDSGAVLQAEEVCGGGDEDCDGMTDEAGAADVSSCQADGDGDGYPGPGGALLACTCPDGRTDRAAPTDCDDSLASIRPAAPEDCNHRDADCDGRFDEGVGESCGMTAFGLQIRDAPESWVCQSRGSGSTCGVAPFSDGGEFGFVASGDTSRAQIIHLPVPVDLGNQLVAGATFDLLDAGGEVGGGVGVFISDGAGLGPAPSLPDARRQGVPFRFNTLAAGYDLTGGELLLYDGVDVLGRAPVAAPSCVPTTDGTAARVSLELTVLAGEAFANLRCGGAMVRATVSATVPSWKTRFYDPVGGSVRRFVWGASGAVESGRSLRAKVTSFVTERAQSLSVPQQMGVCDDCQAYGTGGLTY